MLTIFSQHIYTKEVVAKSNTTYKYSNTQIDLPPSLVSQILKWGKDNIPDEDISEEEEGTGREDEIHVTVKYGLHTESEATVSEVVSGFGSFEVELGEVSRFVSENKPHDVVKIEVYSPRLHDLHDLIGNSLDNSDKWPAYKPHITIAYVKKGKCSHLSGSKDFEGKKFTVNEITFSSTNGEKPVISLL